MKQLKPILAATIILSSAALAGDFLKPAASEGSGFFAPFQHIHASESGTPFVHSFGVEPAFTGRDLFLDQSYLKGDGFTEHETEVELEWAFTKRLGVIIELPYIYEDEEGVATSSGFGDLAIVPRALLVERERFLLTAQVETVIPTGSNTFGGDTAIAPGIATWLDLGNWFTLNSQISVEHGFDTDETELIYGFALVKSFGENHAGRHHDHGHKHVSHAGLVHLHLEVTGSTPLNGPDEGDFNAEGLVGISYGLIPDVDIRLGYLFPLTAPEDFDYGFTTGLIFHF